MAEKKEPVSEIRIIRRGKNHAGHHGGSWKVAFADFMTAMMAFFLVMWIVGLSDNIKQNIAGYFKDPIAFMDAVNAGKSPFAAPGEAGGAPEKPKDAKGTAGSIKVDDVKKTIEKLIADSKEFKMFKDSVSIKMVAEGLQIELIDGKENLFFDGGSAKLKLPTSHLLSRMAKELGQLDNQMIIEGHTDVRPLSNRADYTNWELSADRANAARCVMQASGLRANQIDQVRGFAATHPRNPDPYHYSNRRVSIIVVMNDANSNEKTTIGSEKNIKPEIIDKISAATESESTTPSAKPESVKFKIDIRPDVHE